MGHARTRAVSEWSSGWQSAGHHQAPPRRASSERERGADRNEAESAAAWPRRLPGSHALPGLRTAPPSASVLPRLGPAFEGAPAEMAKGGFLPHARLQLPSLCARATRCTVDHTPPGAGSPVGRAPFDSTPSLEPRPRPTEAAFTLQLSLALLLQSFARAPCTSLAPIILPDGEALHGLILGHHLARRGTVYTLNVSTPLLVTSSVAALEGHL